MISIAGMARNALIGSTVVLAAVAGSLATAGAEGPPECPSDWNHNQAVEVGDIGMVANAFGTQASIVDLIRVVHDYGQVCPTKSS